MDAKSLYSKEVIDVQGNKIGNIAGIDIDIVLGAVNHVIVGAGFSKKYYIKLHQIMSVGDRVILNIKRAELEKQ